MNGIPVVKSKLIMPQLSSSFIMSERLKKLGKAMRNKSVIVINAPAGYGKTTLMTAALHMYGPDCRICWYRMEQEDGDLAVFYAHFIEALFPPEEPRWRETRQNIEDCSDIYSRYQYINAVICQELWSFHNQYKNIQTFIVLDDFQQVKDSPEITGSIQYLINNLPGNCSIFVSSRAETDILTVKQKLEKNVLEIKPEELCFTGKDLEEFLSTVFSVRPDKKLIANVLSQTEGWAAGIIMMCQAIGQVGEQVAHGFFGEKHILFKYFALEVLKSIDADLMLFLAKAALLRDFTITEAVAILNVENASQHLTRCEKQGLFIQKTIGKVITYHFHGLFREVLQQVQPRYLTGEEIKNCHLRAAAYYTDNKVIDRAIEHSVACGNIAQAVDLITRESANISPFEPLDKVRLWLKLLPEEVMGSNPILLYIKNHIHLRSQEDSPDLTKKPVSSLDGEDAAVQMKTLIFVSYFYVCRNDVSNIIKTLAEAPETVKTANNPSLKGMLTVFDFMKAFWEERFNRGIVLSRRLNSFTLDQDWKWMALAYSCKLHFLLGDLDSAESCIKEAFELDLVKNNEMIKSLALLFYCFVLHLKNDRDSFTRVKNDLLETAEKYGFLFVLGFGKRLSAIESYCRNDLDTALELLESSTNHFEQLGNQPMQLLNKLSRCLWLSGKKNAQELLEEAKEAYRILASARTGQCITEIGQSVLGALAREAGEYGFAEKCLHSSLKKSSSKKTRQVLCGTCLHLAKLYYDTGDEARGEENLRRAFNIASDNRYVVFWDLHLPTLVEMSARSLRRGINADHAFKLMESYYGREAAEFFRDNAAVAEEKGLKDFCNIFISLYGSKFEGLSPKIEISLLGRFIIAVNGTAISDSSWKTRKIEGIFKYLLLHRDRIVTRESLMELFWPEADKRSASMSLRAALYELRKVLTSHGIPPEGRDSLIRERGGGLTVPLDRMLFVDADEFQSLYNQLKEISAGESGELKKIGVLERMISLYNGNLLEDEIFEDWAYFAREELRSIYLESAISLALIYIGRKEYKKAERILLKTLAQDQYNEEVCLNLLRLYISTNQRSRAVKMYNSFKNRLKKDLNIEPEERLASLIKVITIVD